MALNQGLEFRGCYSVILGGNSGAQPRSQARGGAASNAPEAVLSKQSLISIVDDDQSFRDSMRRLLKSLGYAVAVFPSAAEFLASPKLAATACLVADIHMPAITGVELYKHLIETGHAIPTILVTAYPDDSVAEAHAEPRGWSATFASRLEEAQSDRLPSFRLRARQGASRGVISRPVAVAARLRSEHTGAGCAI